MIEDRRGDAIRLSDILAAIRRIAVYTKTGREAFLASPQAQDAVIRNLEVIGEAAGKLSSGLRAGHPEVEWAKMRGFASFAKHEYWKIDLDRLWAAIESMPAVETKIGKVRPVRPS